MTIQTISNQSIFNITEKFTKSEFLMMCNILNGVRSEPNTFIVNIICGMEYEATNDVNNELLIDKLNTLTDSEIEYLHHKVYEFWNTPAFRFDIDERLAELDLDFEK